MTQWLRLKEAAPCHEGALLGLGSDALPARPGQPDGQGGHGDLDLREPGRLARCAAHVNYAVRREMRPVIRKRAVTAAVVFRACVRQRAGALGSWAAFSWSW